MNPGSIPPWDSLRKGKTPSEGGKGGGVRPPGKKCVSKGGSEGNARFAVLRILKEKGIKFDRRCNQYEKVAPSGKGWYGGEGRKNRSAAAEDSPFERVRVFSPSKE